jgi:hypothetical protein
MLPGFRFLLAAILLSASILVFGLGAASLLRASHEQYVSNPSWRNGPQEQVFAQSPEPVQPVLAALRAEPEAVAEPMPSLRDQVPTISLPASEPEQVAETGVQSEPKVADAAPVADAPAAEPAKVEAAAPSTDDTLTSADTTASIPEDKPAPPMAASAPQPAEPTTGTASSFATDMSKVAALNDPATTAWRDPPVKTKTDAKSDAKADGKTDSSTPESKAAKPRAHRVKKRRRIVRRPPPPVQQLDPFGQQQPTLAATTARARQ